MLPGTLQLVKMEEGRGRCRRWNDSTCHGYGDGSVVHDGFRPAVLSRKGARRGGAPRDVQGRSAEGELSRLVAAMHAFLR